MRLPFAFPAGLLFACSVLRLAGEPPVMKPGIGLVDTNGLTSPHFTIETVKPQAGLDYCTSDVTPGQGTNYVIAEMQPSANCPGAEAPDHR
ncbi:MAG TPA: hypothetical protein VKU37_12490 [Verrucomicrobiae bacterium]|nr:hypothetical protein [Verrucomicrobiae bacterium]